MVATPTFQEEQDHTSIAFISFCDRSQSDPLLLRSPSKQLLTPSILNQQRPTTQRNTGNLVACLPIQSVTPFIGNIQMRHQE
ncbi:hypothetical protein SAMD00019534_106050, partial [Acytostelium subglobosum LB1]|uniref:hypothetical protein n=1 Tax=Acytostelium subglobosum LB1 TaxID=1410327 RepID=UPI000644F415